MSVEPRLHELPALTSALRLARERLEVDATTYGRWSRVARAVCPDPDKGLRVPERFIVRSAPEAEPPLLVDESADPLEARALEAEARDTHGPTGRGGPARFRFLRPIDP